MKRCNIHIVIADSIFFLAFLPISFCPFQFTLMNWGNAIVRKFTRDADGSVTAMEGELHLEGDFTTTIWKLTWLPTIDDLIPVRSPTW